MSRPGHVIGDFLHLLRIAPVASLRNRAVTLYTDLTYQSFDYAPNNAYCRFRTRSSTVVYHLVRNLFYNVSWQAISYQQLMILRY